MVAEPASRDAVVVSDLREAQAPAGDSLAGPALAGTAALWLAAPPMIYLQLASTGRLDTSRSTVSDYVSLPGGAVLLAISVLCVALSCVLLSVALVRGGLPRPATVCVLLGAGCAGLIASVLFPTNVAGSAVTPAAVLHRYAAGLFFVAMPIAGWLVARRAMGGRDVAGGQARVLVARLSIASMCVGLAFLASHVPLVFPDSSVAPLVSDVLPRGVVERVLLVVDVILLGAVGKLAARGIR